MFAEKKTDMRTIFRVERRFLYLLFPLSLFLTGCETLRLPSHYSAEPIEGWVIDAETKKPIEAAIVVAIWKLQAQYGWDSSIATGNLEAIEVLTDANGHYMIPSWGPKKRPHYKMYLVNGTPSLIFFKPDYKCLSLTNKRQLGKEKWPQRRQAIRRSDWNAKTVELEKFEGDTKAYIRNLRSLSSYLNPVLDSISGAKPCDWQKVPKMLQAMEDFATEQYKKTPHLSHLLRGFRGKSVNAIRDCTQME